MPEKKEIPVEMEKVRRRFERWRKARRGRSPIPRRLWMAAANLAREHGVNPTSQALGLEFNKLRSFVESGKTRRKKVTAAARFLELVAAPAGADESSEPLDQATAGLSADAAIPAAVGAGVDVRRYRASRRDA